MKSLYGVHPVHAMNAERRQTAADPWTKPTDLSHWPACRQLRNYIHHRHHLLSPKVDTHFYTSTLLLPWEQLWSNVSLLWRILVCCDLPKVAVVAVAGSPVRSVSRSLIRWESGSAKGSVSGRRIRTVSGCLVRSVSGASLIRWESGSLIR